MRNPITAIGAAGILAGLSSIREVRDGYGNPFTGGPGDGWERAKRSPEVAAMLQEKAQAKRERKAAIRSARATG